MEESSEGGVVGVVEEEEGVQRASGHQVTAQQQHIALTAQYNTTILQSFMIYLSACMCTSCLLHTAGERSEKLSEED